jgi:peptidyl-prolyl cis-trans isomerase D
VYEQFVAQQNMTVQQFEQNFRKQMLLTKLQNLVLEGMVVTPNEVEHEYRKREEKVKLEYVAFSPENFRSQVNPTPADLQAYFAKNTHAYQIPEKRSFSLIVLDEPKIAAQIQVSDEDLQRAYAQNRERYRTGERVRARHILLKTTEKPKEELPKIKARAEDVLKQLRAGADFAELARKHSEDPGSASNGGNLDWIVRGQTVKPFEDAAFSAQPNTLSNVIETQYGYHIIQVLERQQAKVTPFEEVRAQLADETKKQRVFDRMQTVADELRAALAKAPAEANQLAQKYGLNVIQVEAAAAGDPIPEIGVNADFSNALAATQQGGVTPIVQIGADKLAMAVVTGVTPGRAAKFEEVEAQVREAATASRAAELAKAKAAEAAGKVKAAGGDLRKIAKEYGLQVKTTTPFGRSDAPEGLGPAQYLAEAFTKDAGAMIAPVELGDQTIIAKVVERTPADMSKLPAAREQLVEAIKQRKARERDELFKEGLLASLIKEGKVKVYDDTVKRLVANYQG